MPPTAKSPIPIWLTRDHSVPIHDQLVTQVLLGILSDDLTPGQRLPSVRALARVLHVNSNTISAAYRELVRDGWLEARHGSGVYVRSAPVPAQSRLEELLTAFVGMARREGWTTTDMRHAVERELARTSIERLLLFEPEPELRDVLLREIEESCGVRLGVYADSPTAEGALIVAMHGRAQLLERELPSNTPRLLLQVTSIPAALLGHGRPAPDTLIAIAEVDHEAIASLFEDRVPTRHPTTSAPATRTPLLGGLAPGSACHSSAKTWNEPSVRISLKTRTAEPLVVSTAVAPGPPRCTTNSKGAPLPAPSPVI